MFNLRLHADYSECAVAARVDDARLRIDRQHVFGPSHAVLPDRKEVANSTFASDERSVIRSISNPRAMGVREDVRAAIEPCHLCRG